MIKDALAFLAEKFEAAAKPVLASEFPQGDVYLIGRDTVTVAKSPPPRAHRVDTISAFVEAIRVYSDDSESVVWVGESEAVLMIDDADYRVDRVTLPLKITDVFKRLTSLQNSSMLEQKEFVRLLAVDLASALHPTKLLNQVRRVRFETGQIVTANRQRTSESMGREINASVQVAEGEVPERVECMAYVHAVVSGADDPLFAVPCAVEVDASVGRFRLTPLPDVIETTMRASLDHIAETLRDLLAASDGPKPTVLRGSPGRSA